MVITEAGVDDIGDAATSGWAAQMPAPEYLALLARYDQVLAADNYVLGATIFTLKDSEWPSFEIDGEVLGRLADYVAGQRWRHRAGWTLASARFSSSSRGIEIEPPYAFTAEPEVIEAGAAATLRWHVEGARGVFFNGREVAPHAAETVTPERTTGYRLHIELHDESFKDLDVVVTMGAGGQRA